MSLEVWIAITGVSLSILTGILVLIFRFGGLVTTVKSMIGPVSKIPKIEVKLGQLWEERVTKSHSPMTLNPDGERILKGSNVEVFTDKYFDEILASVDGLNPQNAYQAQIYLIEILASYKNKPDVKKELEDLSFKACSDIDTILFVGAINIRDQVIKRLNFNRDDIDKFDLNKL